MTATARALARFKTASEIEAMYLQVLEERANRVSSNIHINQVSNPDGRASAGITLTTVAEQEQFLADCEAALSMKANEAPSTPTSIRFDERQLEV